MTRATTRLGATMMIGTALLTAAGCSTVESIDTSVATAKDRRGAYLHYSVANSLIAIQFAAAQPPKSAEKPSTAAATNTPTSWTITGTVSPVADSSANASAGKAASAQSAAGSTPDASDCVAMNAQYSGMQTRVSGLLANYKAISTKLAQLSVGDDKWQDTVKLLLPMINNYLNSIRDPKYFKTLVEYGQSSITDGKMSLHDKIIMRCPIQLSVTVQQTISPDVSRVFALKGNYNPLFSDTLAFSSDNNGLLTNGAPSSVSQIPNILTSIAGDIGLFTAPSSPKFGARNFDRTGGAAPPMVANTCAKDYGFDNLIHKEVGDICNATAHNISAVAQGILDTGLDTPGSLPNLPNALLPATVYKNMRDFAPPVGLLPKGTIPEGSHAEAKTLSDPVFDLLGVAVAADCSRVTDFEGDATRIEGAASGGSTPGVYDGIVVSAPRACEIRVLQSRPDASGESYYQAEVAHTYLWTQDSRRLVVLPAERGLLVPRSVSYTFANGQTTALNSSSPSELAAFVALPSQIVGSFFSGLQTAYSNSNANTVGKTTQISDQGAYLKAQADEIVQARRLAACKADPTNTKNCN